MKYYFIYETTCLVNNRKYIGAHITDNIDDGYLGCGKDLISDINKFGPEQFVREILEFCNDDKSLFKAERKYQTPDWIKNPQSYNLQGGGSYTWAYTFSWQGRKRSAEDCANKSKAMKGRVFKESAINNMSIAKIGEKNPMYGRKQRIVSCEHCDWSGPVNMYGKYHGDKCISLCK